MIYSDFQNEKLSALGMGCMRLPRNSDSDADIDIAATREMVAYAFENGINYFDTAWGYHEEKSELVMGEVLKDYPRDSFYLASKFPGFSEDLMSRVSEVFERQLEKCQVEYFDFYLFHCVCESNIDGYLDSKYGIFDYLMEQKKKGRIRHLGFSAHASLDTLKRFLDAYGESIEFCQLQINWLDWEFQDAKSQVELVSSYNIPIWVMEPVRGGFLANLAPQYMEKLKKFRSDITAVEWDFRFIQSIPQVKMTLSGMSNFEQLKENIHIYQTNQPLSEEERNILLEIGRDMTAKKTLACTACRYCVTYCPQGLEIPKMINLYNKHICSGDGTTAFAAMEDFEEDKMPSACLGCRACEEVCPQNIKISEMMSDFAEKVK